MQKNNSFKKISLYCVLIFSMLLASCCMNVSCIGPQEKFTKIVHMPLTPLLPGSGFAAKTHNGSITVTGADVSECNLTATVEGRARTVEEAEDVVEQTELRFEHTSDGLVFVIQKPNVMINRSVSVSLDITVPRQVNLELETHNGAIKIYNITGQTVATTHNGKVSVNNISGTTRLVTHNGKIESREVSGDIKCNTHNGGIETYYSETSEPDSNISMVTHNGSIELTTPSNYSANIKASTHNGSINTDLPVTVIGKVSKNNLTGKIGDGEADGELHLQTHNGSIRIR